MTHNLTEREKQALEIVKSSESTNAAVFADRFEVSTDYGRQILNKLITKNVVEKFNVNGSRTSLYRAIPEDTPEAEEATVETQPAEEAQPEVLEVQVTNDDPYALIASTLETDHGDEYEFAVAMYDWITGNDPCIFAAINHAFPEVKWPKIRKFIILLERANVINVEKQGNKKTVSAV